MPKARVAIFGTVGKSIIIDTDLGPRVTALEAKVAALGTAGTTQLHSALQGLQIGDDHPQYTMWQAPETIKALWNFDTIPYIQGDTLAEYIEDVVGGSFFDFLQDTSSVVWTYHETANELEANVPPEFVQDTVGAMLTDTTSIDLSYDDALGTFQAAIIDEYVQDLVGAMFVDTTTVDFTYNDALGQLSAVVPGAALTKVDDTNVTLTLGGSPTTALARAASLTLGWTGTLAETRGGTNTGTYTTGDLLYASATNTLSKRGVGSTNDILAVVGGVPTWSQAISPTMTGNWTFAPASGNTVIHAGNLRLDLDNSEVQLGASQDLRFFHDGTNSIIRNDTGNLNVLAGATTVAQFLSSGYFKSAVRIGAGIDPIVPIHGYRSGIDGAGTAAVFIMDTDQKTTNDGMGLLFRGLDSGSAVQNYGFFVTTILSPTAGAESASFDFAVVGAGAGPTTAWRMMAGGAFAILDGITAPAALSGFAKLYVDVADGDLKIIFGDGTVKTIVTD